MPKQSKRVQSATRYKDIQKTGHKERLIQLKKKRLDQSQAVAHRQMQLEKRRFYKQLDIDIRKQNLQMLMHSQTRLLDQEETGLGGVLPNQEPGTSKGRKSSPNRFNLAK